MARLLQLSPGIAPYDATVSIMAGLARSLESHGIRSVEIAARHIPRGFRKLKQNHRTYPVLNVEDLDPRKYDPQDILIYHHGIAGDAEAIIQQFPGRSFIVYHGITPAGYYVPYNLTVAGRLDRGRRELARMAPLFERAYCFSGITEADLREAGYLNIRKVDPPLLPSGSVSSANPEDASFGNRPPVILCLGRIVPNKNHEPLIRAAGYLRGLHPDAKVLMAGELRPGLESYHRHLRDMVRALGLQETVEFTGMLSVTELESTWTRATHLVCLSQHEGYCLPLVEAMQRNLPVIYLDHTGSAARETMDGAGLGFRPMDELILAELISEVHTNESLRLRILQGQRDRVRQLQPDGLAWDLTEQLAPVGGLDD